MRLLIDDCPRRWGQFADAFGRPSTMRCDPQEGVYTLLYEATWDNEFSHIYLDGDLGCEPFSGEDIARMMAGLRLHTGAKVFIHSANVTRSRKMFEILKDTHDVREVCWADVIGGGDV